MMIAVHAGPGKITHLRMGEFFSIGDFIEIHPGNGTLFVGLVRPHRNIVFRCAGNHTRATPGTFVKIDDHAIFLTGLMRGFKTGVRFPVAIFFFHELPHLSLY
jgi:hypothetical protein